MKTNSLDSLYYRAPQDLRERLSHMTATPISAPAKWGWVSYATAGIVALITSFLIGHHFSSSSSSEDLLAQEVVSSHVRSMMVGHLIDIASTDRHTVKPWFNGKIDFSPKVVDLSSDGFPLTGGRLDYLGSRPVAAMIYQHKKHVINFLTWPSLETSQKPKFISRQGYSIFHWIDNGMEYWVISDLNANDLRTFVELTQRP